MKIASEICIFTNDHITTEELDLEEEPDEIPVKGKEKGKDKEKEKEKEKG